MLFLFAGYLFTDVLATYSIVKKSKKLDFLTPQNGIDNFFRNIINKIPTYSAHSLHSR